MRLIDGTVVSLHGDDLEDAMQYHNDTIGIPELVVRLRELQRRQHAPPCKYDVCVIPGSQDGIAKAFDALLDEEDSVLVESPTYASALSLLEAIGCGVVEVRCAVFGIHGMSALILYR